MSWMSWMGKLVRRRAFPLIASAGLIVVGMYTTTWGPALLSRTEWALPYDLWGTLIATTRLAHGNIGGIYAPPTGLISLPGAAVILVPCAALISALGLSLDIPGPHNLHPGVWLVAGPYQIALCCVTLFAADALAERLGAEFWKRGLLAAASASILWSVSARWGHPEDAVAVGLLLYAILAQSRARPGLAGWLAGAAVCVQPLVLLALPVMLAVLPWRRMVPFLVRAALPSVLLLGAVAIANWHDTYRSVTSQPNSPVINHPTAWTSLAPQLAGQNVAAGPFRLATILLACLCALAVRRHWRSRISPAGKEGLPGTGQQEMERHAGDPWPTALLASVLWWVALTLALRSFFEPVMVSYYPWPPMAVALITAATLSWPRLFTAGILAGALTAAAQGPSHTVWIWWVPIVAGLVVLLAISWPRASIGTAPLVRAGGHPRGIPARPGTAPGEALPSPGAARARRHMTTGGSISSRAGRLAVRPSPDEVPCSRRFTHGARYSLAHLASSRRAATQAALAMAGTGASGRSASSGSRQSSVTGMPRTSQDRSAIRWCDCPVRCSRSGDQADGDRRNRIDHRSTR